MRLQRSFTSTILASLAWILATSFGTSPLQAQSPAPVEDYVMPEELANLQSQYSSIPDCMYEFIVHQYPAIESWKHRHFRFMTARGMWRYERLDENGLVAEKVCFDGKLFYNYHKLSPTLEILPDPPPPPSSENDFHGQRYRRLAYTHFSLNPLFASLNMPFMARPAVFKIPDIHSPQIWKNVMRRSATRHRLPPGTPANQVHFLLDDEALNGILKLEKLDTPGPPSWRVVEHNYLARSTSGHVTTRYEGWMRFPLGEAQDTSAVLHMPLTTTITTKVLPQSFVVTIELLPNTVMKAPGQLSIDDFRIPKSIVGPPPGYVYDATAVPVNETPSEAAKATRPVKPPSTSGQKPDKLGGTELKPAPRLKPSPGLKPAPKL
ncbi:hypothetical protein DES53_1085 [Roseimicrobium gellanilyticum]|uniref:Uncharacterized protein n=1 Tax=Roseimicrobium gellanilyticum TaxID=748857 RepID=A0A366HEE0_9BACT|nr:hypothetical protein [Roseimicrobium gellanilyticum]RBP40299.1 hypothetical protein DES53_1085 [Roseimicrobium gellanilyticum]